MKPLRWWIFCRVVDNFGDAGVCWRLASQLAVEHRQRVLLLIDRPELVARLSGAAAPPPGLAVHGWPQIAPGTRGAAPAADRDNADAHADADADAVAVALTGLDDPDLIVSAFGCELPAWLRARLAGGPARPLWINLEYLSAEPWVDGCHGLASVKPRDGAIEHFFFPGFTAGTGGLLRERDAVAPGTTLADGERARALQRLCGVEPEPGERVISLFCYPDAPLDALLGTLAGGDRPYLLAVPEGVADAALGRFLDARPPSDAPLAPGAPPLRRGRLRLARIPFLTQRRYDDLLRLCDLNFVRGEDSWVRAHWARRPFVWQPYLQDEGTHLVKLEAFLARFTAAARESPPCDPVLDAITTMMRAWSGDGDPVAAWQQFEARLDATPRRFARWTESLLAQPDLAANLVNWARRKL